MQLNNILNFINSNHPKNISSACGHTLLLKDGRKLFDFSLGSGTHVLGHSEPGYIQVLTEQLRKGLLYPPSEELLHRVTEKLVNLLPTDLDTFIFCNSGTEATQRAIRYARAASQKEVVVHFEGAWHGMNEWTLSGDGGRFGGSWSDRPSGLPNCLQLGSERLKWNSYDSLLLIRDRSEKIGAVVVEPLMASAPSSFSQEYLKQLRTLCTEKDIPLIFDETITGFRVSTGGVSSLINIQPDIATYGKILGGGLPVGLVALSKKITQETFLDINKNMLTGGTFSGNPLVLEACNYILSQLATKDYRHLSKAASDFRESLNSKLKSQNLQAYIDGAFSISRLILEDQPTEKNKLKFVNRIIQESYIHNGGYLAQNRLIFNNFYMSSIDYLNMESITIKAMADARLHI